MMSETILENSLNKAVDDTLNENVMETILDDNVSDQLSSPGNDSTEGFGKLEELGKQMGTMFSSPEMQNTLSNIFKSLTTKIQPSSGGDTLSYTDLSQFYVPYEEIVNDINSRVFPHLLSKVSGEGLNGIQTITIDKESKSYKSISMLYNVSNYLTSKGNNVEQITLYRDRLVGQMVWLLLYNPDNFYDDTTSETNTLVSDTMKSFTAGVLNMATQSLSTLNFGEMFGKINKSNNA
jgi:hypothetical protein